LCEAKLRLLANPLSQKWHTTAFSIKSFSDESLPDEESSVDRLSIDVTDPSSNCWSISLSSSSLLTEDGASSALEMTVFELFDILMKATFVG
jgi:hypothetical protein